MTLTHGRWVFRLDVNREKWTAVNTSLESKNIMSLAVLGTTLYAGSFDRGVFRLTTDEGMVHIKMLTGLKTLNLQDTMNLTDAGLAHLAELTALRI